MAGYIVLTLAAIASALFAYKTMHKQGFKKLNCEFYVLYTGLFVIYMYAIALLINIVAAISEN